jgi:hypothetical protein
MRTYMKLISKLDRVALKSAQANQDALEAQRLVQELIAGD